MMHYLSHSWRFSEADLRQVLVDALRGSSDYGKDLPDDPSKLTIVASQDSSGESYVEISGPERLSGWTHLDKLPPIYKSTTGEGARGTDPR